jgi:hypothetical protein
MSLKIESLPQLTSINPPVKGETGDHRLVHRLRAEKTAALVAGVKAKARATDRRVQGYLDMIAGRHP